MRTFTSLRAIGLIGALAAVVSLSGCAVHARYYDAGHADYHAWGPGERGHYNRWEAEQHRRHEDYKRLNEKDRQDYWNWRHDHP